MLVMSTLFSQAIRNILQSFVNVLQVGLATLTGVGFCVLLIPVNRWLAVKIAKLSKDMMEQKDNRVKVSLLL